MPERILHILWRFVPDLSILCRYHLKLKFLLKDRPVIHPQRAFTGPTNHQPVPYYQIHNVTVPNGVLSNQSLPEFLIKYQVLVFGRTDEYISFGFLLFTA